MGLSTGLSERQKSRTERNRPTSLGDNMSDKLFDEDTPSETVIDENKNFLEELVGEGKKYKDPEALAKAAVFKDQHISRLEAENQAAREELKTRTTLEEFLDQMKTAREEKPITQETNPDEKPALDETKIESLLEAKLAELERRTKSKSNLDSVMETLSQKWGSTWRTELKRRTDELGVGQDFVTGLASEKPKAFFKLLDVDALPEREKTLSSRLTSMPSTSSTKNQKYYRKMMVENPKTYWKAETQQEMFDQLKAMGDDFYI
jgi:hypothetical protein